MTATALLLLSLTGTIVEFGPSEVTIDRGRIDGLRAGDRASIFYLLSNGEQEFRFELCEAEVIRCQHFSCDLRPECSLEPSPGYRVQLEVGPGRSGPRAVLGMLRQLIESGELDAASFYLERAARLAAGDAGLTAEVRELEARLQRARRGEEVAEAITPPPEPPPEPEHLEQLRRLRAALEGGDAVRAQGLLEQLRGRVEPDEWKREKARLEALLEKRMLRLPATRSQFGRDRAQAAFHNQTPRFQQQLAGFWIDREPVTRAELGRQGEARAPATGLTQTEAASHCRQRGLRLPTEFEWELASSDPGFETRPGVSEWTSSWYLPYPGNAQPEAEYGRTFKVVRGFDYEGRLAPEQRFFLEPDKADPAVGFRCARDAIDD